MSRYIMGIDCATHHSKDQTCIVVMRFSEKFKRLIVIENETIKRELSEEDYKKEVDAVVAKINKRYPNLTTFQEKLS